MRNSRKLIAREGSPPVPAEALGTPHKAGNVTGLAGPSDPSRSAVVHLALPQHRIQPGATVSVSVPYVGRRRFDLPEGVQPGSHLPLETGHDGSEAVVVINLLDVAQRQPEG